MALIVGVPAVMFINNILVRKEGPIHALKDYIAYYYLRHQRKKGKHRLESLYDILSNDPVRFGMIVPPSERTLEFPKTNLQVEEDDNILIFGANCQNEQLTVRISRTSAGYANVWVNLRLSNGKSYVHAVSDKYLKVPKTGEDTFAAGGLRIKCLTAMRRWRVSYNGILRESSGDYVHAKFSFIWAASSHVIDFSEDIPVSILSHYLASQKWEGWLPNIEILKKNLDSYAQSGMLFGTVSINSEEETEVYLWGGRKRSVELPLHVDESLEFLGYLKDGDYFHVSRLFLPNNNSSLDYGCIMMPTGFFHVMDDFKLTVPNEYEGNSQLNSASIEFTRDKVLYSITVDAPTKCMNFGNANVLFAPIAMNDDVGQVMIIQTSRTLQRPERCKLPLQISANQRSTLTVNITELSSNDVDIAGGKGASLGQLSQLSRQENRVSFVVPKGLVITTKAYERFLTESESADEILHIENAAWKHQGDLKECCERTVSSISGKVLPMDVKSAIEIKLIDIFGDSLDNVKFAVRSSAVGEDSEDMSAAGQMDTFLGVQCLSEITKAIVKCWASQFSFTAVQYKRQNGQLLNTPMAVVVQEMVAADTAGVTFTCDPVTGNPQRLTITANYGIGESVVSASAEPDTIVLERNERDDLELSSVEIGKKATKIVLSGSTGVQETQNDQQESKKCCLSSDSSLLLAQVAIQVENHYACPMDIEWAIKDSQIYLLQARPVTTYDRETDFEIKHGTDSVIPCEDEYSSTANVGEVMLGAQSPLGIANLLSVFAINMFRRWTQRNIILFKFNPYMWKGFIIHQNYCFFGMLDTILRFHKEGGSIVGDSQMIAMCGKVIEDPEMIRVAMRRNKKDTSKIFSPKVAAYIASDILLSERRLQRRTKLIEREKLGWNEYPDARILFTQILNKTFFIQDYLNSHGDCSFASSLSNLAMLTILRSAKGEWHEDVYNDFASVVSNCPKVESVDVPHALQKLSAAISKEIDSSTFQKMNIEDAITWLQTTDGEAGRMFKDFIRKHGHRCLNEIDVYAKPWYQDVSPIVVSLKEMVGKIDKEDKKIKMKSTTELLNNLKVQLNWKNRLLFRIVAPYCRRAVGQRERSKSLFIKAFDILRRGLRVLETRMTEEGRLPDGELLYFLTFNEIDDLLRTRSPRLVQIALRRKNAHKELNELRFPDMMTGIPKPITRKTKDQINLTASLTMKGTPVSQGTVRGFARVATTLKEATDIQQGEILIAYGTDIGWSPYFPMLAGVATELGGLISHGAVVAREYGLPCVVGVHGATELFQSGDFVLLDGNKGILERIDQQHQSNGTPSKMPNSH